MNAVNKIQSMLFELQDTAYRDFQAKLMPTVDPTSIIGVRTPALRKLAAQLFGSADAAEFIGALPHRCYEENNLHGFLIEAIKDYSECVAAVSAFLPYVDNWATCDMVRPKVFAKHTAELMPEIRVWLQSEHTYTTRFGIGMLMGFYLDANFKPEYLKMVAAVQSDEYYVNMMRAWYFATALCKQYDAAVKLLENNSLDRWTHNKTIQKATESYRVTDEHKAYLKSLKAK